MNVDPLDARFMTEAEIARELGVTTAEFKAALPELTDEGLPVPDVRFFNRRYWPEVKLFLDWRYGLAKDNRLDVNLALRRRRRNGGEGEAD
jgi:hypothetical protein